MHIKSYQLPNSVLKKSFVPLRYMIEIAKYFGAHPDTAEKELKVISFESLLCYTK